MSAPEDGGKENGGRGMVLGGDSEENDAAHSSEGRGDNDEEIEDESEEEEAPVSKGEIMIREALMSQIAGDIVGALRRYLYGFKVQPSLVGSMKEEFLCCLYESSSCMDSAVQREQLLPLLRIAAAMFNQV